MTAPEKVAGPRSRGPNENFGFVRVATASPKLKVADCVYNAEQIVELMKQAQGEGVAVLVFPELCLTGYTCADLFQQKPLQTGAVSALGEVTRATEKLFSGVAFVGMPLVVDDQLFNCAVAVHGGRVLGVVPKMFPPTYKEFYESRWFRSGSAAVSRVVTLNGQTVPFGTDLLFCATDVEDLVIGAEVCEDLWTAIPPSSLHALHGATVLVNLSASNELIGKANYRRQLVVNQAARCMAAYLYSSCGVHESTTDVVFGGHCLISENGSLLAESKRFQRGNVLVATDIDLERMRIDRVRTNSFGDSLLNLGLKRDYRRVTFALGPRPAPARLLREVEAHPFVPRGEGMLRERCEEIFSIQVAGLARRLEHVQPKHVTIGVSGGLDSTLALLVTCKAFDLLGWSRERIHAYTMPGFGTTKRTRRNAHALMKQLGVSVKEVDIRKICLEEMRALGHSPFGIKLGGVSVRKLMTLLLALPEGGKDLVFENIQARMRTSILMNAGFTVGTGDLSELILGWCTYNGDHMSGYNPNASIPKTLVKFLVRWAAGNEFEGAVRETLMDVFNTEISPELLPASKDGKIAQKTEDVVGPYELHDFFIYYTLRFGMSPEKILYLASQAKFDAGYSAETIRRWLKVMIGRFFSQQFKRSCLPDGPKVGSVSVSPRGDLRMPSDSQAALWLAWAAGAVPEHDPGSSDALPSTRERTTQAMSTDKPKRALVRVDIQNGFMPADPRVAGTGELPVEGAPAIVPVVNELSRSSYFDLVVDTQDYHPADHGSFYTMHEGRKAGEVVDLHGLQQILWNPHCRQGTPGTEFYPTLDRSRVVKVIQKGTDRTVDSYSGFWDNGKRKSTGLADYLRGQGVTEVYVVGVTRPFCVSWTAIDSAEEGFKTFLIEDAASLLELSPGAGVADIQALKEKGVTVIKAADVLSQGA